MSKNIKTPVFCGQEPSFMFGLFDSEEERSDNTAQAQRLAGNPINKNKQGFEVYFDGEIEEMIGFDVVCHIDGVVPKLKYGDKIECIAITPDDKEHDAIMYVGRRRESEKKESRVYHYHQSMEWSDIFCIVRLSSDELKEWGGNLTEFKI
tara:strand:- start:1643 stop:2092 length:450 start_codon:yes stop_codon:yes gene_type:complete